MVNMVEKAVIYASNKHSGQRRKDGSIYILHPLEVLLSAKNVTNDEEVLAACILHDVVEECNVDISEIESLFGKRVAKLIILETEKKYDDNGIKIPWYEKKQTSLNNLKLTDDIGLKILILADKLSNLRSVYHERTKGNDLFTSFNETNMDKQEWYYQSILELTTELAGTPLYIEFETMFNAVFNDKKENKDGKNNTIKR